MKFRYKVLFCNIIFVALAFAVSGYLLIRYNYHINLEKSVAAALEENQMLRMATEADIVRRIQTGDYKSLSDIDVLKENIAANLKGTQTEIDLVRENELERTSAYFEMAQSLDTSRKNYIIREEEGSYRLSCMSIMKIENTNVCIVNTKDITDIYEGMDRQIQYFRLVLLVSVGVCSIVMFFISVFLTKSIKMLALAAGKMASGDYSVRCNIRSNDEIGALGSHFNHMAASVAQHVEALEDENRRREDFVANFTHEIKTPMTAVIGYSDMLRSKHMTEEKTRVAA